MWYTIFLIHLFSLEKSAQVVLGGFYLLRMYSNQCSLIGEIWKNEMCVCKLFFPCTILWWVTHELKAGKTPCEILTLSCISSLHEQGYSVSIGGHLMADKSLLNLHYKQMVGAGYRYYRVCSPWVYPNWALDSKKWCVELWCSHAGVDHWTQGHG